MRKLKSFWRCLLTVGKWIVVVLVLLEIGCFLVVTLSNLLIFGHVWEGGPSNYDPYTLFLDGKGVRPTANNPSDSETKKVKHIWMLGGSTMRAGDVKVSETIASYLALKLNGPGSRSQVVTTNYGENSFNSLLETKYLQKLFIENPQTPDLVIFYDGANECAYFNLYRTPDAHYGYPRLKGPIESYRRSFFGLLKPLNTALANSFSKEVYDRLTYAVVPLKPDNPALGEMVKATTRRYDHVRRLSACYGAKFLLFWQPMLWVETGKVDPRVKEEEEKLTAKGVKFLKVKQNFVLAYNALADRLKDQPYFVDFQNVLCARTQPAYRPDGVHLNAYGNRLVAQAMARVLGGVGGGGLGGAKGG